MKKALPTPNAQKTRGGKKYIHSKLFFNEILDSEITLIIHFGNSSFSKDQENKIGALSAPIGKIPLRLSGSEVPKTIP
jgi:hypothetical protein